MASTTATNDIKKYSNLNLLVADDEKQILEVVTKIGEMLGFKVFSAKDGQQAWKLFKTKKPDIVISDIYMPFINGLFLLLKIKEMREDCPVILMTGYAHYKQIIDKDKMRPDGFIQKPFSVEQIYKAIAKTVQQKT